MRERTDKVELKEIFVFACSWDLFFNLEMSDERREGERWGCWHEWGGRWDLEHRGKG